jgi:hypothetical protein
MLTAEVTYIISLLNQRNQLPQREGFVDWRTAENVSLKSLKVLFEGFIRLVSDLRRKLSLIALKGDKAMNHCHHFLAEHFVVVVSAV